MQYIVVMDALVIIVSIVAISICGVSCILYKSTEPNQEYQVILEYDPEADEGSESFMI